ncbi:circularly permuted type 2 ATP-grasp protein [Limibacillus halophilus]|uniref:Putative circularly permuted ATP-grasp superfamily protein n=1 Tax=Limibacillus halophilus TaxID=1579333 RepID=A0A839STH3_9PROT|nr:circularly permuted type 2 ATP-grasp protein [Limibacillus halophilus]MBB3065289.1 putative circularly permuted ATP-grasp superfamily protein [Limibacillus halophilus]
MSRRAVLTNYDHQSFFCELTGRVGENQPGTVEICRLLDKIGLQSLERRARNAERELYNLGITFTVYSDAEAIDRILPFDVIPRVITAADWAVIDRGVRQRVKALNLFLADIYHDQKILKDGVVPAELVLTNANYQKVMQGLDLPQGTYVHICGIDVVRDEAGAFKVLEDNARCPSGVSYVVENRHLMLRTFPDLMDNIGIRRVSDYGLHLQNALAEVAPANIDNPQVVLLSPGFYNSAYFEHVFLAREMGVPLVEGQDLFVDDDDCLYMRTVAGPIRVDVVYRRINDDFLDPKAFRKDSALGVPGLMRAYAKGRVTLANAVGTGVADDKAVYAYMPRIIRYYLDEEAILDNVETHICAEPEALKYTLDHLSELVVKPVGEAGGYGVVVGPQASAAELDALRAQVKADPANYISQPVISLSVSPTLLNGEVVPRHVDLRPFAVTGKDTWVLPGGLTRVALKKGSLVVNSSQGGGSKDTWVLE